MPGWSRDRSSAASTRAGTCILLSCRRRYAATYAFYRDGLATAAARLRAYTGGDDSGYLDEPATAVALASFVLRGVECGAVDRDEVDRLIGIDLIHLGRLARRRTEA